MTSMTLPFRGRYVGPEDDPYGVSRTVRVGLVAGAFEVSCDAHGEFACHSASCRPPKSGGTGGSRPAGATPGFARDLRNEIFSSQDLEPLRSSLAGSVTARTERASTEIGWKVWHEIVKRRDAREGEIRAEERIKANLSRLAATIGLDDPSQITVSATGTVRISDKLFPPAGMVPVGSTDHFADIPLERKKAFWDEFNRITKNDPEFVTYEAVYEDRLRQKMRGEVMREVMREIRDFGPAEGESPNITVDPAVKSMLGVGPYPIWQASNMIQTSLQDFPTDWITISNKRSSLTVVPTDRANYNDKDSRIGVSSVTLTSEFSHEFAHRAEAVVLGIVGLERAFIERRTEGADVVPLSTLAPDAGYGPTERARPDKFFTPYVGKDYNGRAYEVLSTGMENLPRHIGRDPGDPQRSRIMDADHQAFVLGVLACVVNKKPKAGK